MRIGVTWVAGANAFYRAIDPARALERRGHEVVWPDDLHGRLDAQRLAGCDVVHVYRRVDAETWRGLDQLAKDGVALTYDNDDNVVHVPKESPNYKEIGGTRGQQLMAASFNAARRARVVTTTTEVLAELYRGRGVERVEVIPNAIAPDIDRPRSRHRGVVIGWFANIEHHVDAVRLDLAGSLTRVLEQHANARVHCIGIDLGLPERYRFDREIPYPELAAAMRDWDIGIAPLIDHPFNASRSDIKLKEYAACGIAWLASPSGPYASLGEQEGGRLVADDRWFEELDRLVAGGQERAALAASGRAWAKRNTIDGLADRWERVLAEAAGVEVAPRSSAAARRTRNPFSRRATGAP